jgi:hypothetical protein
MNRYYKNRVVYTNSEKRRYINIKGKKHYLPKGARTTSKKNKFGDPTLSPTSRKQVKNWAERVRRRVSEEKRPKRNEYSRVDPEIDDWVVVSGSCFTEGQGKKSMNRFGERNKKHDWVVSELRLAELPIDRKSNEYKRLSKQYVTILNNLKNRHYLLEEYSVPYPDDVPILSSVSREYRRKMTEQQLLNSVEAEQRLRDLRQQLLRESDSQPPPIVRQSGVAFGK